MDCLKLEITLVDVPSSPTRVAKGHGAFGLSCGVWGSLGYPRSTPPPPAAPAAPRPGATTHEPVRQRAPHQRQRTSGVRRESEHRHVPIAKGHGVVEGPILRWCAGIMIATSGLMRFLMSSDAMRRLFYLLSELPLKNLSSVNIPNLCRRNFPSFILTVFSAVHQYFVVPRGAGQLKAGRFRERHKTVAARQRYQPARRRSAHAERVHPRAGLHLALRGRPSRARGTNRPRSGTVGFGREPTAIVHQPMPRDRHIGFADSSMSMPQFSSIAAFVF